MDERAKWKKLTGIAGLMLCSSLAWAQEDLLDLDLKALANIKVTSASRAEQTIQKAPAVISVITREDIERYGANNLFDVMAQFPGFLPLSDATTGRSGLSLRGDGSLTSERILTLIDGKPYRSVASEGFVVSELYQTFPMSAVERIELIRGPGSAMYGGTAVTGIVNIITRKVDKSGGDATAQAGNRDANQQMFFAGARDDKEEGNTPASDWTVSLAGNNARTDGWSVNGTNGNTPFDFHYPSDQQSLLFNVSNDNFYFKTLWMDMNNNYPQQTSLQEDDYLHSQQAYYDMGFQNEINSSSRYDAHYSRLEIDDDNIHIADAEDLVETNLFVDVSNQTHFQTGFSLNKSRTHSTANFVTGVEDHPSTRGGVYAQVDHAITEKLSFYGGAQWNKETGSGGHTSPRVGVIYQYNIEEGVKLLYNEAFRSPTAVEADMNVTLSGLGLVFIGNPQLSSETVKTWDLQWFHYDKRAEYTLTAFHSQYVDRIENKSIVIAFTPGPVVITPGQFVQNQDLNTYGLEWEGKFHITEQDHVDSNFVWQRNETSGGYESNSLMPCWTATLGYSHIFNNGFTWSVLNQHVSAFYSNDSKPAAPNSDSSSYDLLSSQIIMPLRVNFNHDQPIQLFVRAANLLDETVWQPNLVINSNNTTPVDDGRTLSVGMKVHW